MIREIKQQENLEGHGTETVMIRRTFIEVSVNITEPSGYFSFRKKIPHNVRKIVGVIFAPTFVLPQQDDA